jgi:hypothetical protein
MTKLLINIASNPKKKVMPTNSKQYIKEMYLIPRKYLCIGTFDLANPD